MGPQPGQIQQYINEKFTTTDKSTMESVSAFWLPFPTVGAGGGGGGGGGIGVVGGAGGVGGFFTLSAYSKFKHMRS